MTATSGSIRPMSDLTPAVRTTIAPAAARVAMADDAPDIEQLFSFAREAELRVQSLRMTIDERVVTAKGADSILHEIQLKHPGRARVTTRRSTEPLSRDYDIWLSDGEVATSYQAATKVASVRKLRDRVVGSDRPDLRVAPTASCKPRAVQVVGWRVARVWLHRPCHRPRCQLLSCQLLSCQLGGQPGR